VKLPERKVKAVSRDVKGWRGGGEVRGESRRKDRDGVRCQENTLTTPKTGKIGISFSSLWERWVLDEEIEGHKSISVEQGEADDDSKASRPST